MWIVMLSVVEWELLTDDQKDLHRRELDGLLGGGDGNCVADGGQIAHDALELGCRHLDRGLAEFPDLHRIFRGGGKSSGGLFHTTLKTFFVWSLKGFFLWIC